MHTTEVKFGPLTGAAASIGAGLGGILDTIIFHQIFQLHQMLSSKIGNTNYEQLRTNIFWDGFFQLIAMVLILSGIISLWRLNGNPYTPKATKTFYGSMLLGWGLFITLEGIVCHVLLEIHHVVEHLDDDSKLFWDVLYIVIGVGIGGFGKILISQGKKRFFKGEVKKARRKGFRFRPAFNRRSPQVTKKVDTLPPVHASSNFH